MSAKLFNEDIKKSCFWCIFGEKSEYADEVFCKKHGVITSDTFCKKYKYDPLKRTPDSRQIDKSFTQDDFIL